MELAGLGVVSLLLQGFHLHTKSRIRDRCFVLLRHVQLALLFGCETNKKEKQNKFPVRECPYKASEKSEDTSAFDSAAHATISTQRKCCLRGLLLLATIVPAACFSSAPRAATFLRSPAFVASRRASSPSLSITMASQRLVLWFRNDLRLHDNYVIAEAAKMMSSNRKLEVGCQNVACRIPAVCACPRFDLTCTRSAALADCSRLLL